MISIGSPCVWWEGILGVAIGARCRCCMMLQLQACHFIPWVSDGFPHDRGHFQPMGNSSADRSKESTVDLATIADPWAEATLAATSWGRTRLDWLQDLKKAGLLSWKL